MCEPATIMTVAAVASSAIGAYSAIDQGNTAKKVSVYNARETENEATRTRNLGVEEENKHRQKVAQLQSTQRAQLGASGIDIGSGSALNIQEDTALLGEVDSLRIRSNFQDQATSLDRSAELIREQGKAAQKASRYQAVGSLLTGAAGLAGQWYNPNSSALI